MPQTTKPHRLEALLAASWPLGVTRDKILVAGNEKDHVADPRSWRPGRSPRGNDGPVVGPGIGVRPAPVCMPLWSTYLDFALERFQLADMPTSPLPWAAWPSLTANSAPPSTWTGRNRLVPGWRS